MCPHADHTANPPPVIVGRVIGQHGVRGWLKVYSYTRPAAQILEYDRWMLADRNDATEWRGLRVTSTRRQARKLLAKLEGVDDREVAGELSGKWIAIERTQLAELPPDEYYWSDLIGLCVVDQDGVELGVVDHLIETGANDVLAVRGDGDERLLPWSPHVIVEVDVAAGRLRVQWDADDRD